MRVACTVNGQPLSANDVEPSESLLRLLRDHLGMMGTKNACEQGECGSCSVYLDGVLVCSCLVLAAQSDGRKVTTVEGLVGSSVTIDGSGSGQGTGGDGGVGNARGVGGELHPVQRAFIEAGAVQCGFCTPGLVMATHDLLRRIPDPGDDDIREALAGNLCRCTGYQKIIDAVHLAARL
ncbi:MAG TPA: (2Fe-2S)-binding protein [Acidimicrobiales bacterium]|nr:(2Fe-2S)-binding protein [Acidimicrobiales bacterium]